MNPGRIKRLFVATAGTILEWAEFTFYAYIAVEISQLFFPDFDQHAGILAAFLIFAIGYFMRPLGAMLFGVMGDKYGRRLALQRSIMLMGLASLAIGLLPTYATIGLWAPVLLLVFRCLQGMAVAGEFNGCSIFLIEHSEDNPTLAGSWSGWAAALGMMLGSLLAAIISLPGMPEWAWRIPFLLGSLTCLLAVYLRRHVTETPEFEALKQTCQLPKNPLKELFSTHQSAFLLCLFTAGVLGIYVYTTNVYYVTYLSQVTDLPSYQTKLIVTLGEAMVVLLLPFAAVLADRVGGKKVMSAGFFLFLLTGPLLYWVAKTQSFFWILMAQVPHAVTDVLFSAPLFKFVHDLFPTQTRYTGVSLAWSIGVAFFGGTAPVMASFLQHSSGIMVAPAFYIMLAGLLGLLIVKSSNYMACSVDQNNH